ncbi:MAG: flagellar export chaperone FliS [Methylophilus sp.]|uniref:flagellar export chaperone FliS n=1 Tax=Methylophilus sp. TaxID=29541 RepID=UPI003F9F8E66
MFGMKQSGINAYAKVGLETGVVDASPLKLTVMLYEGAITACINAQQAMGQGDITKKGECLTKAISIIDNGLRASLDKRSGGQIASNLDELYLYMTRSLMQASLRLDVRKVGEIQQLLMDLKSAWETVEKSGANKTAPSSVPFDALVSQKAQSIPAINTNRLAVAGV